MRNLLKSKKAQFFVLSAVVIVSILYLISNWVRPFSILDTSSVVLIEEPFIFNNIIEKAEYTISLSKTYEDLNFNLGEYKEFVTDLAVRKGYDFNFNYAIMPSIEGTPSALAMVCVRLKSPRITLESTRVIKWQPS